MSQISLQRVEADLASLTDNFASLVRSARIADDGDEAKRPAVRTAAASVCSVGWRALAQLCGKGTRKRPPGTDSG